MKPRAHSYLLLLVIFILGMILGALIQSNLRSGRMKHFSIMRSEDKFIEAFESAIAPLDDAQAASVHAILAETAPRIIAQVHESREQVRTELEAMHDQLVPLLNEEQQARLEERMRPPKRPRKNKTDPSQ